MTIRSLDSATGLQAGHFKPVRQRPMHRAVTLALGLALAMTMAVGLSGVAHAQAPGQGASTATPGSTVSTTVSTVGVAASPAASPANATALLGQRLQALYPATRFGEVAPTPWPGLFEVTMGANLAYVDASGRYFLFGHLYDMQAQQDLSAQRKEALPRIDFAALPLGDALTEVRGNGERVLAVFSDPDCPYCRRLEADLRELTDVTLHTFLMPLAALHPQARRKAVSVWCAPDRLQAWKALMLRDQTASDADCDHPVDRNIALGERLGIQGTPTLIAADGRIQPGAASLAHIEAWLNRSSPSGASGATR